MRPLLFNILLSTLRRVLPQGAGTCLKHRPFGGARALLFGQASLREAISVPLLLPIIPIPSTPPAAWYH